MIRLRGRNGGQPHGIASSETLVEDFRAAVDFSGGLPFVDRERIGVIGVCGSGGFGLAAAEVDPGAERFPVVAAAQQSSLARRANRSGVQMATLIDLARQAVLAGEDELRQEDRLERDRHRQ